MHLTARHNFFTTRLAGSLGVYFSSSQEQLHQEVCALCKCVPCTPNRRTRSNLKKRKQYVQCYSKKKKTCAQQCNVKVFE